MQYTGATSDYFQLKIIRFIEANHDIAAIFKNYSSVMFIDTPLEAQVIQPLDVRLQVNLYCMQSCGASTLSCHPLLPGYLFAVPFLSLVLSPSSLCSSSFSSFWSQATEIVLLYVLKGNQMTLKTLLNQFSILLCVVPIVNFWGCRQYLPCSSD